MLLVHHLPGLLAIPSFTSSKGKTFYIVKFHLILSSEWFGILFVRHGYYAGGVFKFRIILPNDFPSEISPVFICLFLLLFSL